VISGLYLLNRKVPAKEMPVPIEVCRASLDA
jgi:hypothetical protein